MSLPAVRSPALERQADIGTLALSVRWLLRRANGPLALLLGIETAYLAVSGAPGATAFALIAGGIGVTIPRTRWIAGVLSGTMIFSWVFLVHIPRALASPPGTTNETVAVFEALAMSGIGWLIAASASSSAAMPTSSR